MQDAFERARDFLRGRHAAYHRLFLGHGTDTDEVLQDLAKFCRAHESTFHADPRVAAMLDGRREVWNRIAHHLHLDDEQLWAIYGNHSLTKE